MASGAKDFVLGFSRALGKVVVDVHGPLAAETAPELKDRLVDVIDGQGNRQVVLDLRGLTRIDGAGLSVLVDALKRMQKSGGQLTLSGPTTCVARAFEAAGLDQVFFITPSWEHPSHGPPRTNMGRPGWRNSG